MNTERRKIKSLLKMISLLLLVNRQGKVRLIKWYLPFEQKEKKRFVKEVRLRRASADQLHGHRAALQAL